MKDGDVLAIQLKHLDGVAVLAVRGEIDADTAPHLRESVERARELGVPVILDMAQVTFMDSSGITALFLACGGTSDALSNPVQIQRPFDQVRRVLCLTGVDKVLPIKD